MNEVLRPTKANKYAIGLFIAVNLELARGINVAAVEAEFKKFSTMDKCIIDLIPAAAEAVKQESMKKMKLFGSDGKADARINSTTDVELITKLVAAKVAKYLKK